MEWSEGRVCACDSCTHRTTSRTQRNTLKHMYTRVCVKGISLCEVKKDKEQMKGKKKTLMYAGLCEMGISLRG